MMSSYPTNLCWGRNPPDQGFATICVLCRQDERRTRGAPIASARSNQLKGRLHVLIGFSARLAYPSYSLHCEPVS